MRTSPTLIGNAYAEVKVGGISSCARKTNGQITCWGAGSSAQIGDGTYENRSTPTAITSTDTFGVLGRGITSTLAVTTDGRTIGWGSNGNSELATGDTIYQTTPVKVLMLAAGYSLDATTTVAAYLNFTVSSHAAGSCNGATSDAASVTSTAIDFGEIPFASARVGVQDLQVTTNAANGYSLNLRKLSNFASSSHTISDIVESGGNPVTFPTTANVDGYITEAFGYTTDAASGNITQPAAYAGGKWAKVESADDTIASASGPRDQAKSCVAFRYQTNPMTPAGAYTGSVLYTVVPRF